MALPIEFSPYSGLESKTLVKEKSNFLAADHLLFSSKINDVGDDVDLLEMYLISGNVEEHFVVSSRSLRRTPLITPSKSYVVDVVAFSNCRMLLEDFSSSSLHY
ncbi:hypothetical protein H5410_004943 [Solanum commersonii]|uniref:Uncharacterized protein n=1 Tax=Solanum commersonii TaxID=4109 RepID=A0A9J6A590_SOLCO|nr:hypothetical protein H5410_004943 [Solanum commersonii]